jgi:hypothetical protein
MVMSLQEISFMSHHARFILVLLMLAGSSFVLPVSHLVYAHTFSTSESAEFLSLTDQIRAESALVIMNLENNNATLAQAHAEKASSLLNNDTLGEIRERNNRIANSLETGLKELVGNVSSFASASPGQTMPQDRLQNINQRVMSLNDTMAEAITTRVESDQQKNVTTWAMALADLVNVVLSDYGNATGSSFDLTDMSNMAAANTTTTSPPTSNMTTTTATIVDTAAYQSAQYLVNNTILQLFNDTLKPLPISSSGTPSNSSNATTMTQEGQGPSPAAGNMTSSNIDKLEAGLMQLKDDINSKATPNEVMITAHLNINPLLMQTYGLTLEQEGREEQQHSGNGEGH